MKNSRTALRGRRLAFGCWAIALSGVAACAPVNIAPLGVAPADVTSVDAAPDVVAVDVPAPIDAGPDVVAVDVPAPLDAGVDVPAPIDVRVDVPAPIDVGVDVPAPIDVGVACAPGLGLCGAACVSTMTDLAHCGGCGRACAPAHATAMCAAGACQVVRCDAGYVDCDGEAANGCEAAPASDPRNCGGCGIVCGGAATCVAGACVCGGVMCSGRCADLATDRANCGACGYACPTGVACASSRCGAMACAPGLTECGGRCVDASSDEAHCGACGRVCGAGTTCVRGACGVTPWLQQYGGTGDDAVNALARDPAGNLIAGGSFSSSITLGGATLTGAGRGWIAKLSPDGAVRWSAALGGAVWSVASDAAGNVYAVGSFSGTTTIGGRMLSSAGSTDWFAASYTPDGALRWAVRHGGTGSDSAQRVSTDAAGRVWVAGYYSNTTVFDGRSLPSLGGNDMFVAQLGAADGSPQNVVTFGSAAYDYMGGLAAEPSDGATVLIGFGTRLLVGTTEIMGTAVAGAILRFGPDLSLRWNTVLRGASNVNVSDLARDASGNLYAAGEFAAGPLRVGTGSFGGSYYNGFVVSVDAAGAFRWGAEAVGNVGTTGHEGVDALSVGPDGTLFAIGNTDSTTFSIGGRSVPTAGGRANWLAAFNASGAATAARFYATGLSIYEQTLSAGASDMVLGGKMVGSGVIEGMAVARTQAGDGFLSRSPR
nr:hypothetical protein [Deltaproteobacteria bacterium]